MFGRAFRLSLATTFAFAAIPFISPTVGGGIEAEARPYCGVKYKTKNRHVRKKGKYQYQYVPTASGRAGAWR